ncbi:MAG: hypothetical protein QOC66_2521 [Pseudonocardiales bacterium]|nr:hypothetical protein [Pseudonocardiales bacterium]
MARILLIEDEPNLAVLLTRLLNDAGYTVTAAPTGSAGLQAALNDEYDLVLLDLMLPDLPGDELLPLLLKMRPDAKIVILSSVLEVDRRVRLLEEGAADFLLKPFVNAELLARLRLRIGERVSVGPQPGYRSMGVDAQLDTRRREVTFAGKRIPLSTREFSLLMHLIDRQGEACTREELLAEVWGIGFDPGTNIVDVCVRRLRSKLAPETIETIRHVGYRYAAC